MNAQPLFLLPDTDQTEVGTESERLLVSGAPWKGVLLDLYGSASDEEGYQVDDASLKGSKVSLAYWLTDADLGALSAWCDECLPSGRELRALDRADNAMDPWLMRPHRHNH